MRDDGHHTTPPWLDDLATRIVSKLMHTPGALRQIADMEEELLTIEDVRKRLGVKDRKTVIALVQSGGLPMFKIGGQWRITRRAYRQAMLRGFKPLKRSKTTVKFPIGER